MTVDQLITSLLLRIHRDHYASRPVRDWMRDEHEITRAIARYGHECHSRGWEYDEAAVYVDLMDVLDSCLRARATIRHLPVYLAGAVDRHIRLRAEELREAAIRIETHAGRAMRELAAERGERLPRTCETLAALYRDLSQARRARRQREATRRAAANAQRSLF